MSEVTVTPVLPPTRPLRWLKYTLQAMVLLPVVAVFFLYRIWSAPPASTTASAQPTTTVVSAETLAERFGLQITLIGVTAGGGIVDLRYKILDKDKAEFMVGDPDNPPILIAEESGVTLTAPNQAMKHHSELVEGRTQYRFYPNTNNAVRPGSPVSVVIGSIRLESIIAQ
ncbi:MAG: hypothetical protein R3C14_32945 [Caldilineaceae bacterium]